MKNLLLVSLVLTSLVFTSCGGGGGDKSPTGGGEISTYNVKVSVTPSGAGTISPSADKDYEDGYSLTLQADAQDEYRFTGWSGDLEGADNPLSLTVDKDYALTANFEKKNYELSVNTEGEGTVAEQVVQKKGKGYEHGTLVELTATPAEGYRFVEWKGALTSSDNPAQVTVDSPKEITAVFEKKSYPLTVTAGEGGTVVKDPEQDTYEHGATVKLTAMPAEGWQFTGWQGALTSTENPAQLTINSSMEVTAVFESKFYLAENGVTVMCPAAKVGDTGSVNGITYTKRTKDQITGSNAPTTCTSGITDMSWYLTYSFNADISSWDVSQVTDMQHMFYRSSFNGDISSWDVSSVTNMSSMFQEASDFNGDISNWDVGSVTNMGNMFYKATSFNSDVSNWDVSQVTNMQRLFSEATSFRGDLSSWDVSQVTNMMSMFYNVSSFNSDISGWDVSNVTEMAAMFNSAVSFNRDISGWNVGNVTRMRVMFRDATAFNQDLSSWDVSQVTDMYSMFGGAESFNGDISSWDVSNVTNMSRLFYTAYLFNGDISNWDVGQVTRMDQMFYKAYSFNGDIGHWDVSQVTNMEEMFFDAATFNQDISGWCVSQLGKPQYFSTNSPLSAAHTPQWGTCPE